MTRKYRVMAAAGVATLGFVGFSAVNAAAVTAQPQKQTGYVHSFTTGGNAGVTTTDGGYLWCFDGTGGCNAHGSPQEQTGEVHSYTTGGEAEVSTNNGGGEWFFLPD
jgi:hypothetical protein